MPAIYQDILRNAQKTHQKPRHAYRRRIVIGKARMIAQSPGHQLHHLVSRQVLSLFLSVS